MKKTDTTTVENHDTTITFVGYVDRHDTWYFSGFNHPAIERLSLGHNWISVRFRPESTPYEVLSADRDIRRWGFDGSPRISNKKDQNTWKYRRSDE